MTRQLIYQALVTLQTQIYYFCIHWCVYVLVLGNANRKKFFIESICAHM